MGSQKEVALPIRSVTALGERIELKSASPKCEICRQSMGSVRTSSSFIVPPPEIGGYCYRRDHCLCPVKYPASNRVTHTDQLEQAVAHAAALR